MGTSSNAKPHKLEVILYSDNNFYVRKVDLSSIRFGLGEAKVVGSQLVSLSEISDHETRANYGNGKDSSGSRVLLLKFNFGDVGIRCELDRALFLGGIAAGKRFESGISIKPVKCPTTIHKSVHR